MLPGLLLFFTEPRQGHSDTFKSMFPMKMCAHGLMCMYACYTYSSTILGRTNLDQTVNKVLLKHSFDNIISAADFGTAKLDLNV